MKKVLLLSCAALCTAFSWAFNVHFFAKDAAAPAKSVENATKIIFNTGTITVVNTGGESVKVENSLFDYFKFDTEAGVVSEKVNSRTAINVEGTTLMINADKKISKVALFAIDGKTVKTITPDSEDVTISLEDLSAGVYIVSVESAGGNFSKKLIID